MTKRDTFIPADLFMNIAMTIEDWDGVLPLPAVLKPVPMWTGKQVFNLFLPKINMSCRSSWFKDDDPDSMSLDDSQVVIRDGVLLSGAMCKKSVGPMKGGIIHITWLEKGCDETRKFINNTQLTVNHWLQQHGMSIGIADTVADDETMRHVCALITQAKVDVQEEMNRFSRNELEAQPGRTLKETLEAKINSRLNKCRDDAGKRAQESVTLENNMIKMVTSGSKGSGINISQASQAVCLCPCRV
jgi:DNA-directed RNA polymerase II subunit RPB1